MQNEVTALDVEGEGPPTEPSRNEATEGEWSLDQLRRCDDPYISGMRIMVVTPSRGTFAVQVAGTTIPLNPVALQVLDSREGKLIEGAFCNAGIKFRTLLPTTGFLYIPPDGNVDDEVMPALFAFILRKFTNYLSWYVQRLSDEPSLTWTEGASELARLAYYEAQKRLRGKDKSTHSPQNLELLCAFMEKRCASFSNLSPDILLEVNALLQAIESGSYTVHELRRAANARLREAASPPDPFNGAYIPSVSLPQHPIIYPPGSVLVDFRDPHSEEPITPPPEARDHRRSEMAIQQFRAMFSHDSPYINEIQSLVQRLKNNKNLQINLDDVFIAMEFHLLPERLKGNDVVLTPAMVEILFFRLVIEFFSHLMGYLRGEEFTAQIRDVLAINPMPVRPGGSHIVYQEVQRQSEAYDLDDCDLIIESLGMLQGEVIRIYTAALASVPEQHRGQLRNVLARFVYV